MLQGEIDHSSKKDALNLLLWVIHIHTYTHMGTLIHIHNTLIYKCKYKHTNTNTQIQTHKYTNIQTHGACYDRCVVRLKGQAALCT